MSATWDQIAPGGITRAAYLRHLANSKRRPTPADHVVSACLGEIASELVRLHAEVSRLQTDALLWGAVSKVLTANGFAPQHLADIATAVDQWLKGLKPTTGED